MSRWEPNARERLMRAAVEAFLERGFDAVTVAEITERAGLTKRTFFRHYTDKREVLFAGQEILSRMLADAVAAAPDSATPLEAIADALAAIETVFDAERRKWARKVRQVVAATSELHERELLKRAILNAAMADALRERGVPDPAASVAAELGGLAFSAAFARWVVEDDERGFAEFARDALAELVKATAELT